ncbi:hypothetical protein LTR37_013538 [Vermiconidia calcicola]|uniref:Uncharacterized protein n=1 Tax=Vermiconidia calcicola TaxID=1690605 RepID=A0ACC3MW98_9PEZI|nr:hypothetical protein LTR37_013538 [Vermiconidia calcicola]
MWKYEEEDKLLSQLLIDIALVDEARGHLGELSKDDHRIRDAFAVDDVLSTHMRKLWTMENITVTSVFAARLWLDIVDLHQGKPDATSILSGEAAQVQDSFEFHIDSTGALDTGGGVRWLKKDDSLPMEVYTIMQQIERPSFHLFKQMMLDQNSNTESESMDIHDPKTPPEIREARLDIKMIRPHENLNFASEYNPFFSGTKALELALKVEDAGVALANHHLSIFATAHLYNALRQHQVINFQWPVMDRIMELHVGPMFAGELPVTPQAMCTHLEVRIGRNHSTQTEKKQKWKITTDGAGTGLRQLLDPSIARNRVLYQLEEGVQQRALFEKANPKYRQQRQLTPTQFISQLANSLPQTMQSIRINYVRLTKVCNNLMRRVREQVLRELDVLHPSLRQPGGDTNDRGNLFMVLAILDDNRFAAAAHDRDKSKRTERFTGGPHLQVAGKTMVDFLASQDNRKLLGSNGVQMVGENGQQDL